MAKPTDANRWKKGLHIIIRKPKLSIEYRKYEILSSMLLHFNPQQLY